MKRSLLILVCLSMAGGPVSLTWGEDMSSSMSSSSSVRHRNRKAKPAPSAINEPTPPSRIPEVIGSSSSLAPAQSYSGPHVKPAGTVNTGPSQSMGTTNTVGSDTTGR